jgi:8-oxo-dGTP pyrophosphatase MutT (NUDIX family)
MRRWAVVSGLVQDDSGLLLVANRRRNGSVDWSPPGGVIDPGEAEIQALDRELHEETGLAVRGWQGPVYDIRVEFAELDSDLRVVVYRADTWHGTLLLADPDEIVHDARFVDPADAARHLLDAPRWVAEPVNEWLTEPWAGSRSYEFVVRGREPGSMLVERR